jgi:hypothetical protein
MHVGITIGEFDVVQEFLMLSSTHDGSRAVTVSG